MDLPSTNAHPDGQGPSTNATKHARLSQFIETEADLLFKTICFYVYRAGLGAGVAAREVAQEVLGDVVVEALHNAERFDPERSPRAWLLGIAAKVILRYQERARKLSAEVAVQDAALTQDEGVSSQEIWDRLTTIAPHSIADEVVANEEAASLLALVSEADQRVLRLAILHDLSGDRLAQALGVKPGAARVQLHRAITRLRDAWRTATREAK